MTEKKHTLFACVTCDPKGETNSPDALGNQMYQAIKTLVDDDSALCGKLHVQPVKCMGNCKRPCSVAYAGEDKNTLLFAEGHPDMAADVVAFARLFVNNPIGTTPKEKRPESMRDKLVAKIPPYKLSSQ